MRLVASPRRARAPPRARIRSRKNVDSRVRRPGRATRESRVIRVRARSSRVGGVKGRRETRGARARRRGAVPRARSRGHALEHFEVHVVSHLLPGADAVLLHGVAQRLLLRGVPVPSEGHLRRLAPRLGLRLGFHRAVRAARCGPGAIREVRALGDHSRKRTDAAHPVASARALASSRARGID